MYRYLNPNEQEAFVETTLWSLQDVGFHASFLPKPPEWNKREWKIFQYETRSSMSYSRVWDIVFRILRTNSNAELRKLWWDEFREIEFRFIIELNRLTIAWQRGQNEMYEMNIVVSVWPTIVHRILEFYLTSCWILVVCLLLPCSEDITNPGRANFLSNTSVSNTDQYSLPSLNKLDQAASSDKARAAPTIYPVIETQEKDVAFEGNQTSFCVHVWVSGYSTVYSPILVPSIIVSVFSFC